MKYLNELFEKKKPFALFASIFFVACWEFSRIYVPDCVETKFAYKLKYTKNKLVSKIAKLGSFLGISSEPHILRKFISLFRTRCIFNSNCDQISITDYTANCNRIRIYSPKKILNHDVQPVIFYYHGGGFALNSIDDYHQIILSLAIEIEFIIIAIEYPLAPENKYPKPVDECFKTTNFILNNEKQFNVNIDINRICFAGDSAGANISIVLSNQFRSINENVPKLQALINPPTQYFNMLLPSIIKYSNIESFLPRSKMLLWHLGLEKVHGYHEDFLTKNFHTLLADDNLRKKYYSYLDIDFIPEMYKKEYSYYDNYDKIKEIVNPNASNASVQEFENIDEDFKDLLKNLFNINLSPGLSDDEILKKQPKTFIIVSELDTRKDESLIFAQRLLKNGVKVDVSFFEKGFHTSFFFQDTIGCNMRKDLIEFIKKNL